jgi:hypothetical protein
MIGSGLTPLLALASSAGAWSQAAADVLVAHGARPEDQLETVRRLITPRDAPGGAPAPIAACLRWPGIDLRGTGGSLLVSALQAQRFDLVEELLALGANPLARTAEGDGESAISYLDARYDSGKVDERLRAKLRAAAKLH